MLICPQCKFENPDTNKFCQNCGASLTHNVCPQCQADVPFHAEICHSCGTRCGTVWWAIIAVEEAVDDKEKDKCNEAVPGEPPCGQEVGNELVASHLGFGEQIPSSSPSQLLADESKNDNVLSASGSQIFVSCSDFLPKGSYLDPQQRYQLLEPLPNLEKLAASTQLCVRVLDCQPYQISPVEAVITNRYSGALGVMGDSPDTGNFFNHGQAGLPSPVEMAKFPTLAKIYMSLQLHTNQGIPVIHDAWEQGNIQVVLIEDRSSWPYLLDLWRDEKTTSLQMINYLYQMTCLWALLEPFHCRQSLLELQNLRLDEDQALALQMLYPEPLRHNALLDSEATKTGQKQLASWPEEMAIQALGRIWQKLFAESQRTQFGSLLQLLGDLESGKISSLVQLQSAMKAIATQEQLNYTIPSPVCATIASSDQTQADTGPKSDDLPTVVLPMQLISLEHSGITDVGRQRNHNEDYFGIDAQIHSLEFPHSRHIQARALYILCDGMGGHAGGEVASALAVKTVQKYFQTHWTGSELPAEDQICAAIRQANQAIYDVNQQDARSGIGRMGTTLVMLLIKNTQAAVAHVGDSRLYCITRKGGLAQITLDHEVGQREISRGVEPSLAYARPDAYQLTQALGPRDENFIVPDVKFFDISEDTLFVLASDGLSDNNLLENNWQSYLLPLLSSEANLETGIRDLINLANDYNGHDNITALLVRAKVRPDLDSQKEGS